MELKPSEAAFLITEGEVEAFLAVMPENVTEGYLWLAVKISAETGVVRFYTDDLAQVAAMARRAAHGRLDRLVERLEDRGRFAPVMFVAGRLTCLP